MEGQWIVEAKHRAAGRRQRGVDRASGLGAAVWRRAGQPHNPYNRRAGRLNVTIIGRGGVKSGC